MIAAGVVVVGAGQAGVQFADSFREADPSTPLTLIGSEAGDPYQRPQLSKEFIAAAGETEPLLLRTRQALAQRQIDFRDARDATAIEPGPRTVTLDDGTQVGYTKLVLATGSRNRALPMPGSELGGVHSLRTLDDARAIRRALTAGRRLVIVGAGFIGMEVAAAARRRGLDVTVIDIAERPMARMLSEPMSRFFLDAHREDGIDFRLGQGIHSLAGAADRVTAVVTRDGERLPADLVIAAIGIQPNVELAASAGVAVDNGIVVDACLRTNVPHIWAIGDCVCYPHPMA
ncbi:MAG: NAD(P)/FAD-dependent oxidoreductase, partial [Tomitella sp.]|nr:NAD(P)/FAD-dependent oxidoreductase [Tomitella sp.]